MKVIIEIPDDTDYLDITVTRVWIDKGTKEPCLDTMHRGYDVNDLEKVEEKQEPLGDFEDYWSIKDETE